MNSKKCPDCGEELNKTISNYKHWNGKNVTMSWWECPKGCQLCGAKSRVGTISGAGGAGDVIAANHKAIVTDEEIKFLLRDRRFLFSGDAERLAWSELERITRLQLLEERN